MMSETLTFTYTNWRGETDTREIDVSDARFRFAATEWHGEPQWLLHAYDRVKAAYRDFAVKDIVFAPPMSETHSTNTVDLVVEPKRTRVVLLVNPSACFDAIAAANSDMSGITSRLGNPLLVGQMPDFLEAVGLAAYGVEVESVGPAASPAHATGAMRERIARAILPSVWELADEYGSRLYPQAERDRQGSLAQADRVLAALSSPAQEGEAAPVCVDVDGVNDRLGRWLAAALDDPGTCDEMKADIEAWFAALKPEGETGPAVAEPVAWRVDDLTAKGKTCGVHTLFSDYERVKQYIERSGGHRFCKVTPLFAALTVSPSPSERDQHQGETLREADGHWGFDVASIGWVSNGSATLTTRVVARPFGLTDIKWDKHAKEVCAALNVAQFNGAPQHKAISLRLAAIEAENVSLSKSLQTLKHAAGRARLALAGYLNPDQAAYELDVAMPVGGDRAALSTPEAVPVADKREGGR